MFSLVVLSVTAASCSAGFSRPRAQSLVEGEDIMCPFHGGTFDIKTGEPTAAPCVVPIRTHVVTLEDDAVYIELSTD